MCLPEEKETGPVHLHLRERKTRSVRDQQENNTLMDHDKAKDTI